MSNLSPIQFKHQTDGQINTVSAHLKNEPVGWLHLGKDSGVVEDVYVKEEHQNKGIATGMWKHAQEVGLNPSHSMTRSQAGDDWSWSLYRKGLAEKPPENVVEEEDL
jgi:hypothetical protein